MRFAWPALAAVAAAAILLAADLSAGEQSAGVLGLAAATALAHLELNPRQAKRFHNAFRLQLYVAAGQGVTFDAAQTRALARWVALRVRWPALADDLKREPGLLKLLDAAANEETTGEDDWAEEERRLRTAYER